MTIFNTIQFSAFDGTSKVTQPAAPQLSMPDDEAIQFFQQVYERPTETPQPRCVGALADATKASAAEHPLTAERPAELPPATPETLAKVVEENLTLAKELPQPVEVPEFGRVREGADETVSQPVEVPVFGRVREGADETVSQPVEVPIAVEPPQPRYVGALADATKVSAAELPLTAERPAELPPATPETLAKAVVANLTLAKELPQPVEVPLFGRVREGTDETVSQPVEVPIAVEPPQPRYVGALADATKVPAAEHPLTAERPAELPSATPETLAKVVEENLALAKELPQPVEVPVLSRVREGADETVSQPVKLPVFGRVREGADETVSQPVEVPIAVESQQPRYVGALADATKVPAAELPLTAERPAELPPATPETLAKVVEENLALAKELPQPVKLPVFGRVREGADETVSQPVEVPLFGRVREGADETVSKAMKVPLFGRVREGADETVLQSQTLSEFGRVREGADETVSQPVEVPIAVESPQPRYVGALADATKVPAAELPLTAVRPAELPVATPETLAKVVEENLMLAKELPQPVELPELSRVREGADETVLQPQTLSEFGRVREGADETVPQPQAMPETVAGTAPAMTPTVDAQETTPVAGVAAKVSAEAPRTASSVVIEAASAVADTLLVSPHLMRGDGEIRVQLKPDVLDGAQICIKVMGKSMQVEFASVTDDIVRLMTEAQPQLIQRLAEKLPTYEVAVAILPGNVTARRRATKGVGRSGEET